MKKKVSIVSIVIAILIIIANYALPKTINIPIDLLLSPTPITINSSIVKVTKVIDGDTIEIETGQKIRYIGIDTPELHHPYKPVQCFATEAMEKNKELVEGKTVRLEKDISETDKYGRFLRYVFIDNPQSTSAAVFVNLYLVKEGFAVAATFPPDVAYAERFRETQRKAMEQNKGLWKTCK